MKPVRLHPEARAELRAAVAFYRQQAPGLGAELVAEARVVFDRLAAMPGSGSPAESDIRRAMLARFPFTIVYYELEDEVEVVAVMHQRRHPGYWKHRTKGP